MIQWHKVRLLTLEAALRMALRYAEYGNPGVVVQAPDGTKGATHTRRYIACLKTFDGVELTSADADRVVALVHLPDRELPL